MAEKKMWGVLWGEITLYTLYRIYRGPTCHSIKKRSARPRYPKWATFLAEHPGSWSKLTQCPTESVYKVGVGEDSLGGGNSNIFSFHPSLGK